MIKLEGIIYKIFDNYVVLRGFSKIKDLAKISHKPLSYQRATNSKHKKDILHFLSDGEYKYFPEITLACRINNYEGFMNQIGMGNVINKDIESLVDGLTIIGSDYIPNGSYRAKHAELEKENDQDIVRVDGNHRLEPFDNLHDPVWNDISNRTTLENIIIPFTVIFTNNNIGDKFEAGIFYNINFKQEALRQEASLKLIYELNSFENIEKLGQAYPLALKLISKVEKGIFNSIHWLKVTNNIETETYRTTCLKISELLCERYNLVNIELKKTNESLICDYKKRRNLKTEIETINNNIKEIEKGILNLEINNTKTNHYNKLNILLASQKTSCETKKNALSTNKDRLQYLESKKIILNNYINSYKNTDIIIETISSLTSIYKSFEQSFGNIAMLSVLVYYAMVDKIKLKAFINWIFKNGINKITECDDLSKDGSLNLITMFDQIYTEKQNEIFISMQFGDSQSELIYEKIVRAIEEFNKKHQSINLRATPIRIDKTIKESTYTIQDKILEAINSCNLIIADLSSSNINVYHEIGYAMGIAKSNNLQPNIILLYKEDSEFNKEKKDLDKFIGFNLRSLSQLRFKNYQGLVDGLIERLEKHFNV